MQFPFQISLCCCLSLPCLSSLAGEWSAQDVSVVNTPWISLPSHSSFSSRLFTRTCWLFVCCYPWFPKLVLRGTPSVSNMWARTLGHHPWWTTAKTFFWLIRHVPPGIRQYRASFGSQSEGDEATALLPNKDFLQWWLLTEREMCTDGERRCWRRKNLAGEKGLAQCWDCLWPSMIFKCTQSSPLLSRHTP